MKTKRREVRSFPQPERAVRPAGPKTARWPWLLGAAAALFVIFWIYSPAQRAPFLFDDNFLPFALPGARDPLGTWIRGLRPLLMMSYWINARISSDDTFSYHVVNVLLHYATSGLVYLMVRRLLEWSGAPADRRRLLAGFAAALFLFHPVQAEAVAYLAGRSETLSVFLLYAAFVLFLYRQHTAVSGRVAFAILVVFALAMGAKEHTVVLPALLLFTDYWWNPPFSLRGIRGNLKLYLPMALGAVGGLIFFWPLITRATTAGFALRDFTWYQYCFTQCRALWVYIGLFLLPVNLTADWDFPISKTILDHGSIFGFIGLAALAAAAWHYRRRFPLAAYGFFVFLLLMAPTSSILPIRDPVAERRLYLPMIGLLLILVDFAGRLKVSVRALAATCGVLMLAAALSAHARAQVWSTPVALWEDTARKSPQKARAHFQLGSAYYDEGRYDLAAAEFERTSQLQPLNHDLLVDWALACDGLNQPELALAKLHQAAAMEATAQVYTQIALVHAKRSQWNEALDALATAEKLDPNFALTYAYRGKIHIKTNQPAQAIQDLERALALDPNFPDARQDLAVARALAGAAH